MNTRNGSMAWQRTDRAAAGTRVRVVRPRWFVVALALAMVQALPAQAASHTFFGPAGRLGCSPAGPVLQHQVVGLPTLGSTFVALVPVSNGSCTYLCNLNFLITGTSDLQWGGVPLPWTPAGGPNCGQLLVSLDLITPIPVGTTGALHQVGLAIPSTPSLIGFAFHQQMLSLQYILGGFAAMSFGRGGHAVVGL